MTTSPKAPPAGAASAATGISNAIKRQRIAGSPHGDSDAVRKSGAGAARVGYHSATG